jgi:Ion channel
MSAARELRAVMRGHSATHLHLRERLGLIAIATLGVDAIGSVLVYVFERHVPRTEIHTFGDAVFWTTTQLLTVSSQLPNPISTGGRLVDVFLQVWAISVVAALAGSFGAFFHRRGLERAPMKHPPAG